MRRAAALIGLAVLAGAGPALAAAGPENPPPPWFAIADMQSHAPGFADARWLWDRQTRTLRFCRQDAKTGKFACAPDVTLPQGEWALDLIQDHPASDVDSSARFYSPDLDQTLRCTADLSGGFGCE
jgi:hypothetical protein